MVLYKSILKGQVNIMSLYEDRMEEVQENDMVIFYDYLRYKELLVGGRDLLEIDHIKLKKPNIMQNFYKNYLITIF